MGFNPDNMKVTSGRDGNYKSGEVKGRPTNDPNSRKDFKKILDKDSGDDGEQMDAKEIIEENDGTVDEAVAAGLLKRKSPASLFDLTSSSKTVAFDDRPKVSKLDNGPVESPADMHGKMNVGETKKNVKVDMDDDVSDVKIPKVRTDIGIDTDTDSDNIIAPVKETYTTRFSTEQPDLSYINPLAAAQNQVQSVNLTPEKRVIPTSNLQQIISQLIEKMDEVKNAGSTETVVTLKLPPMFEGARIVVTDFDNARNEFNITIENLTQAAKLLVDQEVNRNNLLLALEQKGYAVHILSTTTIMETRVVDVLPQEGQGRQQQGQQQQEGRQQQRGREGQA